MQAGRKLLDRASHINSAAHEIGRAVPYRQFLRHLPGVRHEDFESQEGTETGGVGTIELTIRV